MSFGERYANVYDSLYYQKDYRAEAEFATKKVAAVLGFLPSRIMDMGCGTGLHAIEMASRGVQVSAVDLSEHMIALAEKRRAQLLPAVRKRLLFQVGDVRSVRLGTTFDAVVALFHVMSYMADKGDFISALRTARHHLRKGGALLFDYWHGPSVIADPPRRRERTYHDGGRTFRRISIPEWEPSQGIVRIRYHLEAADGQQKAENPTGAHEVHAMRYFFEQEIRCGLAEAQFELLELAEWLTGCPPSDKTFGVFALAKAR